MARVVMKGNRVCNFAASHHVDTQREMTRIAKRIEARASGNLARARASGHVKLDRTRAHMTEIDASRGVGKYGYVDRLILMSGDNPMAIEFGHAPSGYFDPDKYGSVTKAPMGLYILSRAAWLDSKAVIPGGRKNRPYKGRKRGKR
jgi:hypothetical protein